jgi:hypothetical protein
MSVAAISTPVPVAPRTEVGAAAKAHIARAVGLSFEVDVLKTTRHFALTWMSGSYSKMTKKWFDPHAFPLDASKVIMDYMKFL